MSTVPASKVDYKPARFQALIPQLNITDALAAIDWYKQALGAEVVDEPHLDETKKKVQHCALKINDVVFFLNSVCPTTKLNSSQSSFFLYVPEVDRAFQRAVKAGATVVYDVKDQFWGDRVGSIIDPYGNHWALSTHIRDVSAEEIKNMKM